MDIFRQTVENCLTSIWWVDFRLKSVVKVYPATPGNMSNPLAWQGIKGVEPFFFGKQSHSTILTKQKQHILTSSRNDNGFEDT